MAPRPALSPVLRLAGCSAAFFLGGPVAAGIAAYGGEALAEFVTAYLGTGAGKALPELPKGLASGLSNFIAGAAYDRMKEAAAPGEAGSLRVVFREALRDALAAIAQDWLPTLEAEDREYFAQWFARWHERLGSDGIPEFNDSDIVRRFARPDAATPEEALRPVLIEVLSRLDAQGILRLDGPRVDARVAALLEQRLPGLLPGYLKAALARHPHLWMQVTHDKLDLIIQVARAVQIAQVAQREPLAVEGVGDLVAVRIGADREVARFHRLLVLAVLQVGHADVHLRVVGEVGLGEALDVVAEAEDREIVLAGVVVAHRRVEQLLRRHADAAVRRGAGLRRAAGCGAGRRRIRVAGG